MNLFGALKRFTAMVVAIDAGSIRPVPAAPSASSAPLAAAASTVPAATAQPINVPQVPQALGRIIRPQAQSRWLLPSVAAVTPQYVQQLLTAGLWGDHAREWELFDLMLDTWPELAACQQELVYGVLRKKLIFEEFREEDEQPSAEATARKKLVSSVLRRMNPDAASDEHDLEGTLKLILGGWFQGQSVAEILWQQVPDITGSSAAPLGDGAARMVWGPRATVWVHPSNYAWSGGRLGLRLPGAGTSTFDPRPSSSTITDFPAGKFLLGLHTPKAGPVLGGAMLRAIAWWWCAANFSADWLMNLAQVFGLPFRWANYDPNAPAEVRDAICNMLQNMGSAGWAAFPAGTTMELKESSKGSDHSPQGELLDRADRYARLLILGQTLSGSQSSSKGGGKAFGAVEMSVKEDRIEAAGKYVSAVLNTQLIPAILALNYGDAESAPTARLLQEEEGSLEKAQTIQALAAAGVEIGQDYVRQLFSIPAVEDGEDTIGGAAALDPASGKPATGKPGAPAPTPKGGDDPNDVDPAAEAKEAVVARIAQIADDALFCQALADYAKAEARNLQPAISA